MHKLIVLLLALTLVGCAKTIVQKSNGALPPDAIPAVVLNTANVWPLQNIGTYLQKITVSSKSGKKHSFSAHITIEQGRLEVVAFADLAGRLYKMEWTPEDLTWEGSSFVPDMIKPEHIITDFLIVHLSPKHLESVLEGAQVYDRIEGSSKSRIVSVGQPIRTVKYSNFTDDLWGYVAIENPKLGYKIEIQTVRQ